MSKRRLRLEKEEEEEEGELKKNHLSWLFKEGNEDWNVDKQIFVDNIAARIYFHIH